MTQDDIPRDGPERQLPRPPLGPRHWPDWVGIGLLAALARLPWALRRLLGRSLGAGFRVAFPARRRVAARNLELCFPELDAHAREVLLREHFAAIGIGVFEFSRAWWGSVAPMKRGLVVEGLEHADRARASGRGIIVVSGHFTTLEICGRLMTDYLPLAGMYRPHAEPAMEWAVKRGRLRYANGMFSKHALRSAVKFLKQGGMLWYAPDQDPSRGDTVYVPFFGRPAHSLASTHQLARMSGASVLAFQHVRRPDGGYTLRILPVPGDIPSKDATADTAQVMAAIETMARAAPEQYLWIHRRFKRQPDGVSPYD